MVLHRITVSLLLLITENKQGAIKIVFRSYFANEKSRRIDFGSEDKVRCTRDHMNVMPRRNQVPNDLITQLNHEHELINHINSHQIIIIIMTKPG